MVATIANLSAAQVILHVRRLLFALRQIAAVPVPDEEPSADTVDRTLWDVVRAARDVVAVVNPQSVRPKAPTIVTAH